MNDRAKRIAGLPPDKLKLLLQKMGNKGQQEPSVAAIPRRDGRADALPLSFAQQRMWFLNQLEPWNPSYNLSAAFRLPRPSGEAVLEQALTEIIRRHEILRTAYAFTAAEPVQTILPPRRLPLRVVDLRSMGHADGEAKMLALATAESRRPYDLASGEMFRATLFKLSDQDEVLLLAVHHIAFDAWSMGVLVKEILAFYTAYSGGQPSPLPELPIQYADFALWQRQHLQGELLTQQLAFWKSRLAGRAILQLPADRPRPVLPQARGASANLRIAPELAAAIKQLAEAQGATLFMTLLSAFAGLLYRYTQQEDFNIGSPIAGRNRRETEGLIGFFVNTLVMRMEAGGRPSFVELLRRVRETATAAYKHQEVPFEKLVEELEPARELSHHPLFQVLFQLKNTRAESAEPGALSLLTVDLDKGRAQFDLSFELMEADRGLAGIVEYNTDLFDKDRITTMLGHFQQLLASIVAAPNLTINDLDLMSAAERQQLLFNWNETAAEYPEQLCLHELFEAQVYRTPDAVALVGDRDRLSYGELNRRANRLAHYLRQRGARPEATVGICMNRSTEMVVGLLAILKSGAAYVPLDPAYPTERLAYIAADSGLSVLLTETEVAGRLALRDVPLVEAATDQAIIEQQAEGNPATGATATNLAYVIYTSGSTGKPKGVAIAHQAAVGLLHWAGEVFSEGEITGVLASTSICFDLSVFEIFVPLSRGGKVILADNALHLSSLPAAHEVTLINTVPSAINELLNAGAVPASVGTVNLAGEPLPGSLVKRIYQHDSVRKVYNLYGPSEDTTYSTFTLVERGDARAPTIGRPIANTRVFLLDANLQPMPVGIPGHLYLSGDGLARGYLQRPDLTAERFLPDPFAAEHGRLYATGDLARYRADGEIEFLGRSDNQVKLRGFRIELGEVETALHDHPQIQEAVAVVREDVPGDPRLVAYYVAAGATPAPRDLRQHIRRRLPEYMVPAAFVQLDAFPLLPNGKIARQALAAPDTQRRDVETRFVAPETDLQKLIAAVWQEVLQVERVGLHDNFFDLGGHSLLLAQAHRKIQQQTGKRLAMIELFQYPTIHSLCEFLGAKDAEEIDRRERDRLQQERQKAVRQKASLAALDRAGATEPHFGDVAIIGMACRFPRAGTVEAFWGNLLDGVEAITFFTADELIAAGVDPLLVQNPNYVRAAAMVEDIELFDAAFFGFSPLEAQVTDPQQRVFLECAWEALERAGYNPDTYDGDIGVYAGVGSNTYLLNIYSTPGLLNSLGGLQTIIGNDKDFLPTRVSYKLNLRGPSLNVQTACSTSLVATHLACQSLLNYQCDMALAGGVSLDVRQKAGYMYQEGGVASPDGHCRAFDAEAQGSIFGNGAGVVVLKRLADAIRDRDPIHAVIKGSAINNDGSAKVGYTAPSVTGQAQVIARAQALAGVAPETIGYVEAHGTGTALGDPIEVAALTQVFRASTDKQRFVALGSVKSNFGHLRAAAGVAGLIKTALALKHGVMPPSLHFESPNPQINFDNSPFFVNTDARDWTAGEQPRRAGVSSFGIGGTNAHLVLEQPPEPEPSGPARPAHLVVLSAKSPAAVEAAATNLAAYLEGHSESNVADVAYTTQVGRKAFAYRRAFACQSGEELIALLKNRMPERVLTGQSSSSDRSVSFMFSGLGDHYVGMAAGLYHHEPILRREIDRCSELLTPILGVDLREILFPQGDASLSGSSAAAANQTGGGIDLRQMLARRNPSPDPAAQRLNETALAQPIVFVLEYALARLLISWGIRPSAMIGYSLGEYVAACLAGVFSIEDGLRLVAGRARLIAEVPAGAMLAVPLSEAEVRSLLDEELSLAAINGTAMCVVAGPVDAVARLADGLQQKGIVCRRLQTSHAFHSSMLEAVAPALARLAGEIRLSSPIIPFISNVTGTWITPAQATDPAYWARHMCEAVRFGEGLDELARRGGDVLVEVGPGQTLSTFARQNPSTANCVIAATVRHAYERQDDEAFLLNALGKLWVEGLAVDWAGFYEGQARRRVELPTYPFERQRYWVEGSQDGSAAPALARSTQKRSDIADWFYSPSWKRVPRPPSRHAPGDAAAKSRWLFFADDDRFCARILERLREAGHEVVTVMAADGFARTGENRFTINPALAADYDRLFSTLSSEDRVPDRIAHLWCAAPAREVMPQTSELEQEKVRGFYSLLYIAQAAARNKITARLEITVVSSGVQEVTGAEEIHPERALLLGPCKVIPQEYLNLVCRSVDIGLPPGDAAQWDETADDMVAELTGAATDLSVAYRGPYRWVQEFEPSPIEPHADKRLALKDDGVYLITGGLGGIGLILANHLAQQARVKLVLVSRSALPERSRWQALAATNGEGEALASKVRAVLELEDKGAEVLALSADVVDPQQLRACLDQTYARFGRLDGVIHAAGIVGRQAFATIQEIDEAECERQFAAKVDGLKLLASALAERRVEFCVLFSSISSVLGGLGFVAYAAANLFMDAFAHQQNRRRGVRYVSVNWDAWQLRQPGQQKSGLGASLLELAMTPAEGVEAFDRILSAAPTQAVVSTGDLNARIDQWVKLEATHDSLADLAGASPAHSRPHLQTAYAAPRNELERQVAEVWQQVLGVGQVGVHDGFLELGGHSLLATQLILRLRATFHVELPLKKLFEAPTVAQLAVVIEQYQQGDWQPEEPEIAAASRARRRAKRLPDGSVEVCS